MPIPFSVCLNRLTARPSLIPHATQLLVVVLPGCLQPIISFAISRQSILSFAPRRFFTAVRVPCLFVVTSKLFALTLYCFVVTPHEPFLWRYRVSAVIAFRPVAAC